MEKKKLQKKSHNAENCQRGPLGVFEHPFFCRIEKKLKGGGGHLELLKNICEKKSDKAEKNMYKKILVKGGTRIHVLLGGPQKVLKNQKQKKLH